jgi:hypothetical protein
MSLNVDKENIDDVEVVYVAELEAGTTFVGSLADINGEARSGVFLVTNATVVLLDDCDVTFDSFDRDYGSASDSQQVHGFREVDSTLQVDGYTDN